MDLAWVDVLVVVIAVVLRVWEVTIVARESVELFGWEFGWICEAHCSCSACAITSSRCVGESWAQWMWTPECRSCTCHVYRFRAKRYLGRSDIEQVSYLRYQTDLDEVDTFERCVVVVLA